MVNCGLKTIKFVIFFVNFLIFALSVAVVSAGLVYLNLVTDTVQDTANLPHSSIIFLVVVSCVPLVISFMGCWGAVRESPACLYCFSSLLLLVFLAELVSGGLVYRYRNEFKELASSGLMNALQSRNVSSAYNVIDDIQNELQCCGVNSIDDYNQRPLPASCCPHLSAGEKETCVAERAFKRACLPAVEDKLRPSLQAAAVTALAVALVQLSAVIGSCCLARAFRREYDIV